MKKTLLALAALAASSAAFAQSFVTLYGVVDVSVERVKGDHQVTRVSSGNLATSRLGFKGTEDIGGGLKANFVLESAVNADTGAQGNSNRLFDRAAWAGLAGGAGELRLGRQDSAIGALAGDTSILGGQAYDDLKIVKTRAAEYYRRLDNAVTYVLPQVMPGLSAQLQYSTASGSSASTGALGSEAYGSNFNKSYGLSVKYAEGPVLAGLGYLNVTDDNSAVPGNQRANATLVYAGYDLGAAKVIAYMDNETGKVAAAEAGKKRLSVYGVKAIVPVSAELTVSAGVSKAKNIAGSKVGNDDAVITAIKANYKLSKRTSVYGLATLVNNESGATVGMLAPTSGDKLAGGVAVGVAHAF
ncbi:porin [Aquabacterium sp.]|uniref:porin n=1 Tax=Aquabacterium sp. TaxID=1872578 RepID=UPI002E2FB0F3|nr:porin [Aquabacterium sp.]HEX5310376.1 porin [Aquabacterium sp.]